jgi:hypothetical protein
MGRDNIRCHKGSYGKEYVAKLKEHLSNQSVQMGPHVRFGSIPPREPPVLAPMPDMQSL